MELNQSIDFLLENAGDVIQYRLHKEILRDVSKAEEENLLARVMQTPHYKLLESYKKTNGYIGIGMHSWDKFKETPLQDGESAARLISNYALPKDTPIVAGFADALMDHEVLAHEFSYYHPEAKRFQDRHIGMKSGFSLQLLFDTCLALMGFGDDGIIEQTMQIAYDAFVSLLAIKSIDDITHFNPNAKRKYNYPYVEADTYLPCIYHLQALSHTQSWKTPEKQAQLAKALNHQCKIMRDGTNVHVRIGNNYYVPLWALVNPIKPYDADRKDTCYRRMLTDIAKTGVGQQVEAAKMSAERLMDILEKDGILRMNFASAYEKRRYKMSHQWPTPYSEVGLESDYKDDIALWCDLTFWAVEFMHHYNRAA